MSAESFDTSHAEVQTPRNLLTAAAEITVRWRLPILCFAFLLTGVAWPLASELEFDQSIESLYSDDDPHFAAYARSKEDFGGDEFAIIAWSEPGLFVEDDTTISEQSRLKIDRLSAEIAAVPGTEAETVQHAVKALAFPYQRSQVVKLIEGMLVGANHETTAIVIRLKPESLSPISRGETIARIREIASAQTPPAHLVGEPVQVHDMFRYVEEDGRVLFRFSLALLAAVLFALFRTLRWVIVPLMVVVITIRWTEAFLVLTGIRLSMVSSMLNSLVTIIGVATSTHLAMRFREHHRSLPRRAAVIKTLTELLPPIFWTCATTAVGFCALLSSSITPVRSFGLMMSVATLIGFLVVLLIAPGGMARWRNRSTDSSRLNAVAKRGLWHMLFGDPVPASAERHLDSSLVGISRIVSGRPGMVALIAAVIVVGSIAGLTRLRIETDFSRNFRDDSELVQALNFVESELGGAGTWEVSFPAPSPLTDEFLDEVAELASRLRNELLAGGNAEGKLTKVVSLTDGLELVPRKVGVGFLSKTLTLEQRLGLLRNLQGEVVDGLFNPEQQRMRIMLRGLERQKSESKVSLIARAGEIAGEVMGAASVRSGKIDPGDENLRVQNASVVDTSGLFVLLTFLIESLLRDQIVSFGIAAVGIGTMMSIAFRSVKIGLISLVPNLLPIVFVLGSMGWGGVPVNIASAMIASVSMGLTVDNSVHYLTAYRRARRDGADVHDAVERAQTLVGRALVFANVALIAGFSVLTVSQFIPLVYFGVLVSAAMIGGLAGNLFLLPLLLCRFDRGDWTCQTGTQNQSEMPVTIVAP